jgi:hypothetical protein
MNARQQVDIRHQLQAIRGLTESSITTRSMPASPRCNGTRGKNTRMPSGRPSTACSQKTILPLTMLSHRQDLRSPPSRCYDPRRRITSLWRTSTSTIPIHSMSVVTKISTVIFTIGPEAIMVIWLGFPWLLLIRFSGSITRTWIADNAI